MKLLFPAADSLGEHYFYDFILNYSRIFATPRETLGDTVWNETVDKEIDAFCKASNADSGNQIAFNVNEFQLLHVKQDTIEQDWIDKANAAVKAAGNEIELRFVDGKLIWSQIMRIVNSLRPFSGDKFRNSDFFNPQLLTLNKNEDGDIVGRMSVTICPPNDADLLCEFDIVIAVDESDDSWKVLADDNPQIALGAGFEAGDELDELAAYELNQVYCLDEALRQFDGFIDDVSSKLDSIRQEIGAAQ